GELAAMCREEEVEFAPNAQRLGHYAGDLSALRKAVEWGQGKGLLAVAKLSQRLLITRPGWLDQVASELLASAAETAIPLLNEGREATLFWRTEAMVLKRRGWAGVLDRLCGTELKGPTVLRVNVIIVRTF